MNVQDDKHTSWIDVAARVRVGHDDVTSRPEARPAVRYRFTWSGRRSKGAPTRIDSYQGRTPEPFADSGRDMSERWAACKHNLNHKLNAPTTAAVFAVSATPPASNALFSFQIIGIFWQAAEKCVWILGLEDGKGNMEESM